MIWFFLFFLGFMMAGGNLLAGEPGDPSPSPEGMVYIPEGLFRMGSTEKDGRVGLAVGVDELPRHEVFLKGYSIDRYEVSVAEFKRFLDATGWETPRIWTGKEYLGSYPPPRDDHPMAGVSWYAADAFCRWAGKRLPTEEEWEKAARGTDGRPFPWGGGSNTPPSVRANTRESGEGWTVPVGRYPEGVSPHGVHDMAGNVMEWTASWYQPYPGSTLQREAFGEKYKVLRGGSWENPSVPFARSAYRHAVDPHWDHPAHGFRCARGGEIPR